MARLRFIVLAAPIGVGLAAAALVHVHALAQIAIDFGPVELRAAIDDLPDDRQRRKAVPPPSPAATRIGQIPFYGTPPAAGAGATGFVSTNAARRKAKGKPAPMSATQDPVMTPPVDNRQAGSGQSASVAAAAPAALPAAGKAAPPDPAALLRKRRLAAEEDPYDPVGLRGGAFLIHSAIEVMGGYASNPSWVPGGRGSALLRVAPEMQVKSDWERHQLDADIRGSYAYFPSVPLADQPNLDAKLNGRIDVTRDTRVILQGRYLLSTEYPGSPNLPADIARLPIFTDAGATAGIAQRFNRLDFSLKGAIDRTVFLDSLLADGTTSGNADRNYDQYGAQLRAGYDVSPGIKPFVEIDADTRIHDLRYDRDGFQRDSNGVTPVVGATLELARRVTGEAAVGYVTRVYRDPTLPDLKGLVTNGSLVWTATPLTSVKLTARTTAEESVLPDVSGLLRRDAGVEVDHAFRRWLIGIVKLGFGLDDYVGSPRLDHRYFGSAGLTYKLTRTVQIKGELRRDWLVSNIPGQDFASTTALLGLRFQE